MVINSVPDSKVNSSVSVNGTLKDEYGDNVSGVTVIVTVDGFNYTSTTDNNGNWNITYLVNSSSEISVVATFAGDVNYTAAVNSTEFGGVLINTILVINLVPDSKVNSSVSVNGTLKDEYGDNVSGVTVIVTVDGFNYTSITDSNGDWNITYLVNSSSEISVVATFVGDVNYTAAVNSAEFGGVLINTTLVINLVPDSKVNSSVSVNGTLKDEYGNNVSGATVIVTVNGFNYTSTTDNNGNWNITYLVNSSSEISVVATFVGDVNYTAAVNSAEFGGVLINTTLVINSVPDSKVNSSVSVNGTLKDEYGNNVSGVTVIVTVDGFNYNSTTDSNGNWNITYLVNSTELFNVVAEFVGDVNYTSVTNSTSFYGLPLNSTLVINPVLGTKLNSSVSINGTLLDENNHAITGVIATVTVNGVNHNITTDNNGKWNITYLVNSTGSINVVVVFNGNANYTGATDSLGFNGLALNSTLVINSVPDSKVNSTVSVNGTLLDENNRAISGVAVVVTVNGVSYNSTTDGSGKWNITYLVGSTGSINVGAVFDGNVNYTGATDSVGFNGLVLNSTLLINSVPDSKVNSSVSINGTLLDENNRAISGVTVFVIVNGVNYNITTDGEGKWNITYLVGSTGLFNVVAVFDGNVNYTGATNTTTFNGLVLNSILVINPVPSTDMNSSVNIKGTLSDEKNNPITGVVVSVTVNGVKYTPTTDNNGNWNITYLVNSTGIVNVVAVFDGNVNYTGATNSSVFNGLALNSTLVINPVPNTKMNTNVSINGTLLDENQNAITYVTVSVTINGVSYNGTTDGSGKWNITYLVNSTGSFNVVGAFDGNVNYTSATNSTSFNGLALNSTLVINPVPNTKVNTNVSIKGTLLYGNNNAINGVIVSITVNGANYTINTDTEGKWNITYFVNSTGSFNVVGAFDGNVNYAGATNSTSFNGLALNSTLVINSVPNAKVNSSVSINGTLLDGGSNPIGGVVVSVTVNGVSYTGTTDGSGKWDITYLVNSTGSFNVVGAFDGNANYAGATNSTSFNGLALNSTLVINSVPNIKVNSSVSVNGTLLDGGSNPIGGVVVSVTVNGVNYTGTTDGSGKWNITYLVNSTGLFNVVGAFDGNVNYVGATNSTSFNGLALNSTLVINSVPNIKVNSSVSINGTLLDEKNDPISNVTVFVTVNGVNYTRTTDGSGKWNITYFVNSTGSFNVVGAFEGNAVYTGATNSTSFNGLALNSTLVINSVLENVSVNNNVSINGTLLDEKNDPISGVTISVTVNSINYNITADNGGNWNITYLVNSTGIVNVVAVFDGNAVYTGATNSTSFNGVPLNSTLIVNPVPNTKINTSVSINGTLLDENNGPFAGADVFVTVNGVNYNSTTDGSGNWNITYLVNSTGIVNVVATFDGNVNYTGATNSTGFNGVALNSILVINPVPGSNVNSSVSINGTLLDENNNSIAGADVIATVNGVNYTGITDGSGNWNITYLVNSTGSFNVVVVFNGNTYYTGATNSTSFNGVALNSTLVINSVPNTKVNTSVSINGTLLDENNNSIAGVNVSVTVNGVNYTGITDGSGRWSVNYLVNSTGLFNVVAVFDGNAVYTGATNSIGFSGVALNSTLVIITPIPNTKVNTKVSINGTLLDENNNSIAGVNVYVTVNGVNYTRTTDNAGKWNVTYLVNSTVLFNVVAVFDGNSIYTGATNSTGFNGLALNSNLIVNPVSGTKVNSGVSINGTLLDERNNSIAGVNVSVTVNGVNYTGITDGSGRWSVNYLVNSTGLFNVVAVFDGNVNYTGASNSTSFSGVALSSNLVVNFVPDTKVNISVSINGTLLDGNNNSIVGVSVFVTVNGVNYTGITDGSGKWNVTYLVNSTGLFNVVTKFGGNVIYTGASNSASFSGLALNSNLVVNPVAGAKLNSSVSINGTLLDERNNPIAGVNVSVTVNGVNYTGTTDGSGKWNITYLVNSTGSFNIVAVFNGNVNYTGASNGTSFSGLDLYSTLVVNPVAGAKLNSSVSINGTLLDENNRSIAGVSVVVVVNGVNYTGTTDGSGRWSVNYLVNSTGIVNVVAVFGGNVNYAGSTRGTSFSGLALNSTLVVNPVAGAKLNSSVSINGTLLDENNRSIAGVSVVVAVNGVNYTGTTDGSGRWSVSYLVNSTGIVNVVAVFGGNVNYAGSTRGTSFSGLALNSTLVVNPVAGAKLNSSVSINGTLLDENNRSIAGVSVVVAVNGVNYTGTTDGSGRWSVSYLVNSTGIVNVVAVFKGNVNYTGATNGTSFNVTSDNVNISIIKIASVNGVNTDVSNVHIGNIVIYTINVVNNGANGATGVIVTDILDSTKLKFNKASVTQGSYNNDKGLWTIGGLGAGKTVTLTINVTVIAIGNISNSANISANEKNINSKNKSTVNITVSDVNISMSMVSNVTGGTNPHYGDVVSYKITITNNGITDGHGVNLTDILGNKLKFISYSTTDGSKYDQNTGIWSIGTFKAGSTVALTINAKINDLGEINNAAKINTKESNINNKTNNSIKFTVNNVNLTITKTNNITGKAQIEDYVEYTIKVTNNGLTTASNFNILEKLGSRLQFISYSSNIGTYNDISGSWNISSLSSGKIATLTIKAKIISTGTIKNTATINTTVDNIGTNNSSISIVSEEIPSQISTINVIGTVDNSVIIESILKDNKGNPIVNKEVKFYVNGEFVGTAMTNVKGVARFSYVPKTVGKFTYTSIFTDPTGVYGASRSSQSNVIVNKDKITLALKLPTGYVGDKKTIKVKATNSEGKLVPNKKFTVYINGKKVGTYKTNSKGEFAIKTTLKSSNKLQIKFAGDSKYDKLSKKYTYKAKTKEKTITTVYYTKTKYTKAVNLTAKLTNGKGKALAGKYIKFYVAGKYVGKAKTNKKGIAVFKYTPKKK
ncbi:beta strand repeat-containing protein [Methanobrevibacter filiformis]|uniref:DUF11 domain-containing protein n=1 Tax=Methanobrevibacter filiformis TaxID=55758 RepID=A0A165ZEN4_9EURY|nr:DUF11 domain-containing protein [Methanobrevibacter filiformis]KZX10614.1 hypothetical protein MBFIL_17120 [Methanobrevibacter filiformis]